MTIRVKLFAAARELAGSPWVDLELPAEATIGHLRIELARHVPALAELTSHMAFAVGTQYAGDETPIHHGDQVACIPPVSGG